MFNCFFLFYQNLRFINCNYLGLSLIAIKQMEVLRFECNFIIFLNCRIRTLLKIYFALNFVSLFFRYD